MDSNTKDLGCFFLLIAFGIIGYLVAIEHPWLLLLTVFLVVMLVIKFFQWVMTTLRQVDTRLRQQNESAAREQAAVKARAERARRQQELEEAAADGQSVCLRCRVIEPERCEEGHCLRCAGTCGSGHCQKCQSCNTCPRCGCGGGNECDRCRDFMDDDD